MLKKKVEEALNEQLNREFFLGLKRFETHYALYPSGAFYKEHLDTKLGARSRVISVVYYLNPEWSEVDGGQLVLVDRGVLVLPKFNRLVIFKSESILHKVNPTQRERMSLTGWFHVGDSA
jgi:SM-20-related protein